jgi:hypothetical protein
MGQISDDDIHNAPASNFFAPESNMDAPTCNFFASMSNMNALKSNRTALECVHAEGIKSMSFRPSFFIGCFTRFYGLQVIGLSLLTRQKSNAGYLGEVDVEKRLESWILQFQ